MPVAMKISGHKTESMYNRYNIVSERDLADVKEKMERFLSDTLSDTPDRNFSVPGEASDGKPN
jgi:hypothetical protein